MTFSRCQVDQATFAQQVDPAVILHDVLLDEGSNQALFLAHFFEFWDVDLHIEVTRVGYDGTILHHLKMLLINHIHVARHGDEDVANFCRFAHFEHPEAIHHRFQCRQRVDLGDDHVGTHAARPVCQASPAPAIAGNDEDLTCQQDVGGPHDAINGRLSGAIAIVEEMLGLGIVHGDDREYSGLHRCHGTQTDHTRGGFLRTAHHVLEQVSGAPCAACSPGQAPSSMVICGRMVQGSLDVLVIRHVIFAFDGDRSVSRRYSPARQPHRPEWRAGWKP